MADTTIKALDLNDMTRDTHNVYKTVAILGRRANQIGSTMKTELNEKLAEFATNTDNLEEVVENREQIEIAKYYEGLPKPTLLAIEEFVYGKTYFRDEEDVHTF